MCVEAAGQHPARLESAPGAHTNCLASLVRGCVSVHSSLANTPSSCSCLYVPQASCCTGYGMSEGFVQESSSVPCWDKFETCTPSAISLTALLCLLVPLPSNDETLPGYVCWWYTSASSRQRGFGATAHAIHPTAESMRSFLLKSVLILFPGTSHCYCTSHKCENQYEDPDYLV